MALKAGDEIGQYVLQARLGSGGFGSVWKAIRKGSLIEIPVAVKVSHEDLSSENGGDRAVQQLLAEARAWVSASGHRNVVPVQDAGIWDGHLLLVSELMTDGSLRTCLSRVGAQPMPPKEAVRLTLGILAGLEHLHGLGIVHRDLKPENILLQKGDPRITDFGIARFATRSTQTRGYSGTLQYMSPDAFENRVSHQMDLWAVGVMLFEMLAGFRPFDGANEAQLIRAILSDRVPPLPRVAPAALQPVVHRALERDVSRRFQSAAQFRQALEAAWAGSGNPAQRTAGRSKSPSTVPAAGPPAKNPTSKRRAVLLLAATCVGTMLWAAELLLNGSALSDKSARTYPSKVAGGTEGLPAVPQTKLLAEDNPSALPPANSQLNLGGEVAELRHIPPGEFMMGMDRDEIDRIWMRFGWDEDWKKYTADEGPMHRVKVNGFELGVTEVTVGQFQAYCRATGKEMPKQEVWNSTAQHPVHNVSWDDAVGFCEWATSELKRQGLPGSVRLPTEAEWEFAARAEDTGLNGHARKVFVWGDDLPRTAAPVGNLADARARSIHSTTAANLFFPNYDDGYGRTAPVGKFPSSVFGLKDMAGNVWEWCQDRYYKGYYPKSSMENPHKTTDKGKLNRVLRGGSWGYNPYSLRASARGGVEPDYRDDDGGFRIARTSRP